MVKPDWIDSRRFDLVFEETRKVAAARQRHAKKADNALKDKRLGEPDGE